MRTSLRLTIAICVILAIAASACTPVQPQEVGPTEDRPNPYAEACGADVRFTDDEAPLISTTHGSVTKVRLGEEIPSGAYEIEISLFDVENRSGQKREQVNVIVDGHRHGPTPDLPGEVDGEAMETGGYGLGLVLTENAIDEVTIWHANTDSETSEDLYVRAIKLICPDMLPKTTEVMFDDLKLFGTEAGPNQSNDVGTAIYPGEYSVTLGSFDDTHPESSSQPGESWHLEGLNPKGEVVIETDPIPDLPDNKVTFAAEVGTVKVTSPVSIVRAIHTNASGA